MLPFVVELNYLFHVESRFFYLKKAQVAQARYMSSFHVDLCIVT